MKLILTGCTGFIGSAVLHRALHTPTITSIIALTRRPLAITHDKLITLIMDDFTLYPDSVLQSMAGANACIWCMGTTAGLKTLELDYPRAFTSEMQKLISSHPTSKSLKFRYIHLSGAATERDQSANLWFSSSMRKIKGLAETNLLALAKGGIWEAYIVKSGFVVKKDGKSPRDMLGWALGDGKSISVDVLAAAMVDLALTGDAETTLANDMMVSRGREALQGT